MNDQTDKAMGAVLCHRLRMKGVKVSHTIAPKEWHVTDADLDAEVEQERKWHRDE